MQTKPMSWRHKVNSNGTVAIPKKIREYLNNPEEIIFEFAGDNIVIKAPKED